MLFIYCLLSNWRLQHFHVSVKHRVTICWWQPCHNHSHNLLSTLQSAVLCSGLVGWLVCMHSLNHMTTTTCLADHKKCCICNALETMLLCLPLDMYYVYSNDGCTDRSKKTWLAAARLMQYYSNLDAAGQDPVFSADHILKHSTSNPCHLAIMIMIMTQCHCAMRLDCV
jgi:hypothetical protein